MLGISLCSETHTWATSESVSSKFSCVPRMCGMLHKPKAGANPNIARFSCNYMSPYSLFVLSTLGLYNLCYCTAHYVLGCRLEEAVHIEVEAVQPGQSSSR